MRRALGKGLSQLIGEQLEGTVSEIAVSDIQPNARQPRVHFDDDALEELAASIREVGLIQPVVVRPIADGRYELIAGERRWRASQLAGLQTVPALIKAASSQTSLELALIENLQREDIGALECARAYKRLVDEFNLTQEQVATKVGKSRVTIANTLRLLRLPGEVQQGLEGGLITEGHARAILGAEGTSQQLQLFRKVVQTGLSVREVEELVKKEPRAKASSVKKPAKPGPEDADLQRLEEALSIYFGSPVHLVRGERGGKLSIEFYSDDDLQRILDVLGVSL